MSSLAVRRAARILRAGGVIAYPTEAVWGFGCDPRDRAAVVHLLEIKQRDWRKGLILIASDFEQVQPFVADVCRAKLKPAFATWPGAVTWLLPASAKAPHWITGGREQIAVRVTAHPAAAALCGEYGGAIVSTSANIARRAPARTLMQLRRNFGDQLDFILPGELGGQSTPTPIRELGTGRILRS